MLCFAFILPLFVFIGSQVGVGWGACNQLPACQPGDSAALQ